MQIASQFRKPISPLKQRLQKYITSPPCVPTGCTRQGLLLITLTRDITFTITYIPSTLIDTTHNFKWSWSTLTTLNKSQLQTSIYLPDVAHPRTPNKPTWPYNTAYSTSQTYHTQSSPEM